MSSTQVPVEIVDRLTRTTCRIHVPYEMLWRALRADTKPSGHAADHVASARFSICSQAKQALTAKGRTAGMWLNWSDIADSIQDSVTFRPIAPVIHRHPGQLMLFSG